jgi:transcriptional regulator of acetoin/glycerol metabolism
MERALIGRAVEEAGGNLALAARRLGIARSTLYRHLARSGETARRPGRG